MIAVVFLILGAAFAVFFWAWIRLNKNFSQPKWPGAGVTEQLRPQPGVTPADAMMFAMVSNSFGSGDTGSGHHGHSDIGHAGSGGHGGGDCGGGAGDSGGCGGGVGGGS